jgi:hypothetical protein
VKRNRSAADARDVAVGELAREDGGWVEPARHQRGDAFGQLIEGLAQQRIEHRQPRVDLQQVDALEFDAQRAVVHLERCQATAGSVTVRPARSSLSRNGVRTSMRLDSAPLASRSMACSRWWPRLGGCCDCADAARMTRSTLAAQDGSLMVGKSHKKAIVALEHKMIRLIHIPLWRRQPCHDQASDCAAVSARRNVPLWLEPLEAIGQWPVARGPCPAMRQRALRPDSSLTPGVGPGGLRVHAARRQAQARRCLERLSR